MAKAKQEGRSDSKLRGRATSADILGVWFSKNAPAVRMTRNRGVAVNRDLGLQGVQMTSM